MEVYPYEDTSLKYRLSCKDESRGELDQISSQKQGPGPVLLALGLYLIALVNKALLIANQKCKELIVFKKGCHQKLYMGAGL